MAAMVTRDLREWNDFDEKEEDYDRQEKQEEREKNQRKRFIMKEFKKRNQGGETSRAAPEEWEPPDEDCVLRDASSRRIPRLTVKAREHCLHMLEVALRDNFVAYFTDDPAKIASSDYEPKVTAIDLEYEVFKASKMINIYKASVMKKNNEIKKMTKSQLLHPSLVPSWAESKDKTSPENSPSSDSNQAPAATFSGFQKASELTCIRDRVPEEETNCDMKNSKINNIEEEEEKKEVVVKKEVPQITYFFEKLDKKSEDCESDKDKVCDEKTRTKVSSIKYFFEKDSKENSPEKIDLCSTSTSRSNTSHSEGSSAATSGPESISSTSPTSHQGSCRSESPYTVVDLTRDQETPAMMVDLTSSSPASSHRQSSRSRSSSPGRRSVDTLSSRSTGSPTSHLGEGEPPAKKQRIQADVTNATSDVRHRENDSRKRKDARGAVETRECKSEERKGGRKDGRNNGETREKRGRSEPSERGEKSGSAQLESGGGGDGGGACNDKNRTKTLNSSLQSDKILPELNSSDGRESGRKTCEAHNNSDQNQREKHSHSALTREKPGTSTRDQTRPGYEKGKWPEKTRKAESSGEKTRKLEGSGDRTRKGEGSSDNNRKGEGEKMRGNPQRTNPPTQTPPATNRPTKPPPDPHSGPAPNTSNKKKKEATELKTSADMVVKYLTVHYKNGQIASKEVFKGMARILSHKIADERLMGDELKKRVKELLKFLFKRCPKITTEQQVKDAMSI